MLYHTGDVCTEQNKKQRANHWPLGQSSPDDFWVWSYFGSVTSLQFNILCNSRGVTNALSALRLYEKGKEKSGFTRVLGLPALPLIERNTWMIYFFFIIITLLKSIAGRMCTITLARWVGTGLYFEVSTPWQRCYLYGESLVASYDTLGRDRGGEKYSVRLVFFKNKHK